MSIKANKKKPVAKRVQPSPVSPEVPQYPAASLVMPKVTVNSEATPLAVTGGVEFDMKVTASDVAEVVVSEIEDALLGQKQDIDVALRSLRNDLTEVQEAMRKESVAQAEAYTNKNAAALAKALHSFLGEKYTVITQAKGLNVDQSEVTAEITVVAESDVEKKETYRRSHPAVSNSYKLPANAAILAMINKYDELTKKIAEQEKAAEGVRRHLADLPRYARKAKTQMTKMALSGSSLTGPELLASLEQMRALALPAPK